MAIDQAIYYMALLTAIPNRIGGIAVAYLATLQKIEEVAKIDWLDPKLDRYELKERMRDVGGATFQYTEFLHENSILALAKCVEDTAIDLKRDLKFKFHPFKTHHDVSYLIELQTIRALANVIKHNVSVIEESTSRSAKYLVDQHKIHNNQELSTLILTCHPIFNVIDYIPKVYLALLHLLEIATGNSHRLCEMKFDDAFDEIYEELIPDILQITRPKK